MALSIVNIVVLLCMVTAVCMAAPMSVASTKQREREHTQSDISSSQMDATPLGMRVNSFFESVADVVEQVSDNVKKAVLHPRFKHDYKLTLRNESVIVASVRGRLLANDTQRDGELKVWKSGIRHGYVIISVDEAEQKATNNASDNGVTTVEHWFKVGKERVLFDKIDVHALNASEGGYEMVIPLYRKEEVRNGVTEQVRRSGEHWGTEREEDEYEFLQAQMECERKHQQSAIRGMICACERTHDENAEHAYRCVLRVLERVMKTARTMGKLQVAMKMYVTKARCSREKQTTTRSKCVQEALQETASLEEEYRRKSGRRSV